MPTTTKLPKNVYEFTASGYNGYRVIVRRNGKITQKYFSAIKYGSKKKALSAATEYANEARTRTMDSGRYVHTGKARSRSGVRGVMKVNESYVAHWYDPPQVRQRVYCGTGSDGLKLAKKIRKEAEQLIMEGKSTKPLLTKYL